MNKYIPKTKDDVKSLEYLNECSFDEVRSDVLTLLVFMQDMHWDVSHGIALYFIPHIKYITEDILYILNSGDNEWKFGILSFLVSKATHRIDQRLLRKLKEISEFPTVGEKAEGVSDVAKEILVADKIKNHN